MRGHRLVALCLALVFWTAGPPIIQGQVNTGTILGNVVDPSGGSIPGVRITAVNEATDFSRTVNAAQDGSYLIPRVPIGDYRLTAEVSGFKQYTRTGLRLSLDQNLRVDIEMEIGSVTETIEVTGVPALVDTHSSVGGAVIEQQRILELPLNGRNALQLATLLPGVSNAQIRTTIDAGNRAGNYLNVNGARRNEVDFQLDGIHYAGSYVNSGLNMPSPDALQEFKLVTSSYSAEYGVFSGAVFRAVLRSGTNDFHGSAWEFIRNDRLNARNFFLASVPALKQNQFGVSAGFPILQNRLFGFVSYQGLRIRTTDIRTSFPLTAAEREGVFARSVVDPLTGQPFPNNTIPADRITPPAQNLLGLVPVAPVADQGLLRSTASRPVNTNQLLGKVDYLISSNDTLAVTWMHDKTKVTVPFPVAPFPGSFPASNEDQTVPLLSISETHIFSPQLLNEVRFGAFLQEEHRDCPAMPTPRDFGINIDLTGGTPVPPVVRLTGRFNVDVGTRCNWTEGGRGYQLTDQVNWVTGRHSLKFGGEYYYRTSFSRHLWQDSGVFAFSGSVTGNAAADFLLGELTSVERRGRGDRIGESKSSFFWFQDDFKVHPRLTLNLGVRYEIHGPYGDIRGPERPEIGMPVIATIRQGFQSKVIPLAPEGLLYPGDVTPDWPDGLNNSMIHLDFAQVQPRVGIAWDPAGDGKTSIRTSFGLYSNAVFGDTIQRDANAPFRTGQVLTRPQGGFADPWAGRINPYPLEIDLNNPVKLQALFPLPLLGFSVDPDYRYPRIMAMAFNIQRQVAQDLMAEVGYVGKLSRHLYSTRNTNTSVFIPGTDSSGRPLSSLANIESRRRLFPNIFAKVNNQESTENHSYHSLQASLRYRASNFVFLSSYTWSKSLDTGQTPSVQGVPYQDSENTRLDRGPSEFDRRHVFTASGVYELPALAGLSGPLRQAFGGWEISGVVTGSTGAPFTVRSGRDNSLSANGNDRPDVIGEPKLPSGRPRGETVNQYFNTAAFQANQTGTFGNAGRSILYGPGSWTTDIGIFKNFPLTERYRLQFRAELFNALNNVTLNNPVSTLVASGFGRITSAQDPRQVQFGLKLYW